MAAINTGGAETSPCLFDHVISVTVARNINKSIKRRMEIEKAGAASAITQQWEWKKETPAPLQAVLPLLRSTDTSVTVPAQAD